VRWLVAGAAVLVVAAALVVAFVTPGLLVTRVFDTGALQKGVTTVLAEDYGVEGVSDVQCPANVKVAAGATFTCSAAIDGDAVTVPIRVTDDDGGYEVGRPS
jgi:hypothetical protein